MSEAYRNFNAAMNLKLSIFGYLRLKKYVKKWRKRAKNSKHRLFVLRQWIATQKSYIRDLRVIQQRIRKPLMSQKNPIISRQQEMLMFANVDVIITLSTNLFDQLDKLQKKWNPLKTEIAPILISISAFFKIYLEYCNQFYKGQAVLKMIKQDPLVQEIQRNLPLDIASYLIKPVQRPPKYLLLLRDYLKHMPQSHPDYKNISIATKKYHEINEINNEAIAREARVERMFYLAKLYDELLSSTRQFINQFQGNIYEQPVKLYILSDMVLITKEIDGKESLHKVILLDGSSFAKRPPDGKYLINKAFICGKSQCVNLHFFNFKSADTVVECVKGVIDKLYKKDLERKDLLAKSSWKRPQVKVRVTLAENRIDQLSYQPRFHVAVQGVEKRPISKFSQQTFYVVKYQLPRPWSMCQLVYTSIKDIEYVEGIVRKRVPNINLISLKAQNAKIGYIQEANHKTKVTELRELIITEQLNYILRNDKVMTNPVSIIQRLKIDENLWTLAVDDTKDKCNCQVCLQDSTSCILMEMPNPIRKTGKRDSKFEPRVDLDKYLEVRWNYVLRKNQLTAQDYCLKKYIIDKKRILDLPIEQFNSLQKMLLYVDTLQGRIDYNQIYRRGKNQNTLVMKVWFQNVSFKEHIEVKFNKETKVAEALTEIGKEMGIRYMSDYGLFVYYSDKPRLLDNDENMLDVMSQTEGEVEEIKEKGFIWGGLDNFKKWGQQIVQGKKSKVYLRKFMFLPDTFERNACHHNFQRYTLLLQQTFYDIKRRFVRLSDDELAVVSSHFIFLKEQDKVAHIKESNFPTEKLKLLLPKDKHVLLDSPDWRKIVLSHLDQKRASLANTKDLFNPLCDDIINIAMNKNQWNTYTIEAQTKEPQPLLKNQNRFIIGVNPCCFVIYDEGCRQELFSIPLLEFQYKVTVFSLFVTYDEIKLRFDAAMLFNFSRVVERYKMLRKLLGNY